MCVRACVRVCVQAVKSIKLCDVPLSLRIYETLSINLKPQCTQSLCGGISYAYEVVCGTLLVKMKTMAITRPLLDGSGH